MMSILHIKTNLEILANNPQPLKDCVGIWEGHHEIHQEHAGTFMVIEFELAGQRFTWLNGVQILNSMR